MSSAACWSTSWPGKVAGSLSCRRRTRAAPVHVAAMFHQTTARPKPGSSAWRAAMRITPIAAAGRRPFAAAGRRPFWSVPSTSLLAGYSCCETKGRTRPTLRSGCGWVNHPCQPGWPVDRTARAVGSRNPPRRLRKEPSMRSVVGISGLKAGEDVNCRERVPLLNRVEICQLFYTNLLNPFFQQPCSR
jgi:hypothetical protein